MRNYGIAWRRFILLQKCQINGRTLFAPTYKQRIYVDCRGRRPRRPACLSLLQHSCIACRQSIFCCSNRALHVSCVRVCVPSVPIGEFLHRSSLDILCKLTKLP